LTPHGKLSRAIVIVLDGVGVGELPDADAYGDAGSDTMGHVARHVGLDVPVLRSLGLGRVSAIGVRQTDGCRASVGRMAERSPGKDSVTGHWEMTGIVLDRPFPVFPQGFAPAVIDEFARRTGRGVLGNRAASGTDIIAQLGVEHMRTGRLIVYTSADSVFQVAAHEAVVPVDELYRDCEIAYALVCDGLGVGRVIARPFVGEPGRFTRTANRRDYALPPPGETLLDRLSGAGWPVVAIGKIDDLFAGRGITKATHTTSDDAGMLAVREAVADVERGLVFANLVDFDTLFGHRNDPEGFAANLERFDGHLEGLLPELRDGDLLIVTADHGNDPTTPSTDHSREYVPLMATGPRIKAGVDLGIRRTFADLGATLADLFGIGPVGPGTSFLEAIR
jgi:phosphopentomutase